MRTAFKRWFAEAIKLSWVHPYQTLIAGVLAVIGAGALLVNSEIERASTKRLAEENDRQAMLRTRSVLSAKCRDIEIDIRTAEDPAQIIPQFAELRLQLGAISYYAPLLTEQVQYLIGLSKESATKWQRLSQSPAFNSEADRAAAASFMEVAKLTLDDTERVLNDRVTGLISVNENIWSRLKMEDIPERDSRVIRRFVRLQND